jgi:transketolase
VARGAYVLADAEGGKPAVILIGTGSEVALCVEAYETLKREGVAARVVSMPSWELFERQDQAYRDSVLPPGHHGARLGRSRFGDRLGSLCGRRRRHHRHARFRRFGPDRGSA